MAVRMNQNPTRTIKQFRITVIIVLIMSPALDLMVPALFYYSHLPYYCSCRADIVIAFAGKKTS